MKILHVEDYFDPTAGYQINELLYASKDFGDEIFLVTSTDMSPFHKEVNTIKDREFEIHTKVKIIRLEVKLKLSSRLILKNLKRTIKDINPDVVFMHGIGDFKDLQLWGPKVKHITIRDCHMSWVASKNKFRKAFYLFYKVFFATIINKTNKYELIYALGNEEYEYLKRIGIRDDKIDYLRHGYNDFIMYYDENERDIIRAQYKFHENDIVISYIGKFNYSKKPDLIIDIIDNLDVDFINTNKLKLLFIGSKDDMYTAQFNKKLEKIRQKIQVVIDDSKPFVELRKYYSASDICIFPKETTLSSIHSQVCGCPTIMEDHKSNIERVINKSNLYERENVYQASNILKRIIINEEFKKKNHVRTLLQEREYKNQITKLKLRIETYNK